MKRIYFLIIASLLTFVGLVHIARAITHTSLEIGNFNVPEWLSYVIGMLVLILAYQGFRLAHDLKHKSLFSRIFHR